VIFNPINLFLLFIDPLIDNVEHDWVVISTAAELIPNLFSMNSHS
jgi:hypothetical protein